MLKKNDIQAIKKILLESGASEEIDDELFLILCSGSFFYKKLAPSNVLIDLLNRFCLIEWTEMTDLRQEIYIIDDEMGWAPKQATSNLGNLLRNYLEDFNNLIKSYCLTSYFN